ncbi:MAG: DUF4330 domain-containing protein [Clostridia bacterium]|nr:DUF4330 domain-containing protein [Clostridia bacterium]
MKLVKKGRLFGILNIFDLFVILVVVSLIAGIYIVFIREESKAAGEQVKVVYELELEETWKELYIDAFAPGEKVFFKESDIYIGTITEVKFEEAWEYGNDLNGNWIYARSEGYYVITLVIEANAIKSGDGFIVENNWNAFNGTTIEFSTRRHSTLGMVKSLEEK